MRNTKSVYIISDSPALKEKVVFGFDAYARTLAELIAYRENKTPLVIGIYGPWGSGKTTLMEAVIHELDKINESDKAKITEAKDRLQKLKDESTDVDAIKKGIDELTQASHKLAEQMYAQTSSQQASQEQGTQEAGSESADSEAQAGAEGENVVDADFEVVDEDKK